MIRRASRECGVQSESCVVWRADYTAHGQGSSVMCARIHAFIFSLLAMMAFHPATALAQGSDPLFDAPWRAFGTGDFPTIRAAFFDVGDIDGDGDLDVVASLQMFSGPGMSILRSNGDGTYAPPDASRRAKARSILSSATSPAMDSPMSSPRTMGTLPAPTTRSRCSGTTGRPAARRASSTQR